METLFPLPPYNEQIQIGDRCSALTDLVLSVDMDQAEMLSLVGNIKAKILDLAIRGKLVPQNPNDEPASILLDRIRAEKEELIKQGKIKRDRRESVIFRGEDNSYYETIDGDTASIDDKIPFDIPDNWGFARLRSIYEVNPRNYVPDETPVSFVPMALIDDQFSGKFTFEIKPWKECKKGFTPFAENDVGFAKISPCFENRKSAIFNGLVSGYGAGTTELFILRSSCNSVRSEYTLNFVKSGYFINRGKGTFSGVVGQQRIDKNLVLETIVPVPPVAEQVRITERISQLFALLDSIQSGLE